jgi:hypothetical protein
MTESKLPEWAESWDGRKHCKKCGARLCIVMDYTGRDHVRICSASGTDTDLCSLHKPNQ